MKKLGALCCVILVTLSLSACRAFHDDSTQNYPQESSMEATVFLQVEHLPMEATVDAELTAWLSSVRISGETAAEDATRITQVVVNDTTELSDTIAVNLTIANVPDNLLQKSVRPFKITYTQKIYNPIALLPDSPVFGYIVGYTSARRHSSANTDWVTTDDEGDYIYLWTTGDTIEFVDVYPNRPLYYAIILGGAVVIGALVYVLNRYNDCKKRQEQL